MARAHRPIAAAILALAVVLTAVVTMAPNASGATAATPAPNPRPFVSAGQTVPVYSYANAIHQTVFVPTPLDSDDDGVLDRVALDLIRPAEAQAASTKVPVILDASPYYACCGRGNDGERKTYAADGTIAKLPLFYDNYFEPRGYAVAALDLPGTNKSGGCVDFGGPAEIQAAKAAVQWLSGRTTAYDRAGEAVTATWSNGRVAMIGKSWDGSVANGVAATGVAGLRTVVALSAISSWYGYARFNGVIRYPHYLNTITSTVNGRPSSACGDVYAAEQQASGEESGDVNSFWQVRDYRPHVDKVRASVLVAHGLNDLNVTTDQFASWWAALAADNVPRKIWLSQFGHVDPFDYRRTKWVETLHQWFDYWLQGIQNGVMQQPQADIQRASGQWTTAPTWPAAGTATTVALAGWGGPAQRTLVDRPDLSETDAVGAPTVPRAGRQVFLGPVRTSAVRVSGTASVTLRVKADRPTTELTVRLVDYGTQRRIDYQSAGEGITTLTSQSCWGQSTSADDACYRDTTSDFVTTDTDVLTRGWLDAAHRVTLHRTTPLEPGHWYSITVPFDATDAVIAAQHRIGVVVALSDRADTAPRTVGATVVIDPARSTLTLPTSGA